MIKLIAVKREELPKPLIARILKEYPFTKDFDIIWITVAEHDDSANRVALIYSDLQD